jgi:hypothetical protein
MKKISPPKNLLKCYFKEPNKKLSNIFCELGDYHKEIYSQQHNIWSWTALVED